MPASRSVANNFGRKRMELGNAPMSRWMDFRSVPLQVQIGVVRFGWMLSTLRFSAIPIVEDFPNVLQCLRKAQDRKRKEEASSAHNLPQLLHNYSAFFLPPSQAAKRFPHLSAPDRSRDKKTESVCRTVRHSARNREAVSQTPDRYAS